MSWIDGSQKLRSATNASSDLLRPLEIVRFLRLYTSPERKGEHRVSMVGIASMTGLARQNLYLYRDGKLRVTERVQAVLSPVIQEYREWPDQVYPALERSGRARTIAWDLFKKQKCLRKRKSTVVLPMTRQPRQHLDIARGGNRLLRARPVPVAPIPLPGWRTTASPMHAAYMPAFHGR